ncbi:RapZ C-terminal domain-containing protein [Actinophytocola sp.]|uniref:RapZ C-terminal domain-containing protein n=1 Tax=Actinophytocola sp. TaxID=1872138 RepID=UPI0039C86CAD
MDTTTSTATPVLLQSFGYLHGAAPEADVTLDVRRWLHDPAAARSILDLDGRDTRVQRVVCRTPGALPLIEHIGDVVADFPLERQCVIAVGCAGGRNRSVALVQLAAAQLLLYGYDVLVEHRDVQRPRVLRSDTASSR